MALARKKTVKKAAGRKKTVAPKKKALKHNAGRPAHKKTLRPSSLEPRKFIKTTRTYWFYISNTVIVLLFAAALAAMAMNTSLLEKITASLFQANESAQETTLAPTAPLPDYKGILLTAETGDPNSQKLKEIFQTVFPKITPKEVSYQSQEGKNYIQQLKITEVPNVFFNKEAFEAEPLSEVVRDIFTLNGNYYQLNVSLVNPSGQLFISGPPASEGAVVNGDNIAPITIYVYSDLLCQHCRVNERNHQEAFQKLIQEGIVKLVYIDLPQSQESYFHDTALLCQYNQSKNLSDKVGSTSGGKDYLELRQTLYTRTNLTKAFTKRALEKTGLDYDRDCSDESYKLILDKNLKTSSLEGITGLPAVYIGQTGGREFLRLTGARDFSEYQAVFDKLLGARDE